MAEIANAWISILPDTSKIAPGIKKAFGEVEAPVSSAGKSIGAKFTDSLGKSLKVGAASIGVAAGGVLATSLTKGFGRLNALDQAQAKMRGLGYDAQAVGSLMDSVSKSVKGTAFGLDEAAGSAAKLGAVGVAVGADMDRAMKLTADIAAQAGTNMEDISSIMAKIAGAGKVTGETLAQLDDRATGAGAALADHLGMSIEEVRSKISKGEVDFATFQEAMEKHLGGAALATGETFKGAFDNMMSATGRLGQKLLDPVFKAAPGLFGSLGASFDEVGAAIEPASQRLGEALVPAFAALGDVIETKVAPAAGVAAGKLADFVASLAEKAVDPALWESVGSTFSGIGESLGNLAPTLMEVGKHFVTIAGSISAATWQALGAVLNAVAPLLEHVLVPALEQVATLAAENPALVQGLVVSFLGFKAVGAVAGPLGTATSAVKNLSGAASALSGAFKGATFAEGLLSLAGHAKSTNPILAKLGTGIVKYGKTASTVSVATGKVSSALGVLGKAVMTVVRFVNPWVAGFTLAAGALTWFFTKTETGQKLWSAFVDAMKAGVDWLKDSFANVWDTIKEKYQGFVDGISSGVDKLKGFFSNVSAAWEELKVAFTGGDWGYGALSTFLGAGIAQKVVNVVAGIGNAWEILKQQFATVGEIIGLAWQQVTAQLTAGWEIVKTLFTTGWEQVKNIFATAWLVIVALFTGKWNEIPAILSAGWEAIKATFFEGAARVGEIVTAFATATRQRFTEIWTRVTELFSTMWTAVKTVWDTVTTYLSEKWNSLRDLAADTWSNVRDTVVDTVNHVIDVVRQWVADMVAKFVELHNQAVAKAVEIALQVLEKFAEMKARVLATVQELPERIRAFFSGAKSWLIEAGKNILQGLWDGLKAKFAAIKNWLSSVKSRITSVFDGVTSSASSQIGYSRGSGRVGRFATGGRLPVHGPGTNIVDGILGITDYGMPIARVNAGEFVVNARATSRFLPLLEAINSGRIDPARGDLGLPGYANGGVVSAKDLLRFAKGQQVNGEQAPRSLEGAPYVWSGGLSANWGDCSGAMSGLAALAVGVTTAGRKFATMDEASWLSANGFSRGMGGNGTLSIGFFNGGPYGGHTSGTITDSDGTRTNVEMGGGRGNGQIGGQAAAANHSQYTDIFHIALADAAADVADALSSGVASTSVNGVRTEDGTRIDWGTASSLASKWDEDQKRRNALRGLPFSIFDTGGVLRSGTAAVNYSGKPEVIINNNQLQAINKLANNVGALVQRIGNGIAGAGGGLVSGAKDMMNVLKITGFGELNEYIEPTVSAFENLQDAMIVQKDAASAITQAENLLGQARMSGDAAKIAAAEQDLAKARGVAAEAAKAAGFAQLELVFTILRTIGRIFKEIWEGQMRAQVGVKKAIADSLNAVREWEELVFKQRETVSKLQQQVVNDQIALTKASWDLRLAQAGVVRAQLEGVKSVADAEAKLQAERDKVARKASRNWDDMRLAYDRYRHAEKQGMVDRLAGYVKVTPEILALEHEVNVAKLKSLSQQYSASLAALEASHAQQMAAMNLAQSQLQLAQQSQQLALMQKQYFGMDQASALTGANTANLYAEKAKAEGRANRGFFGWVGSFFSDPVGTLKYAFGGGAKADRAYAASLGEQIAAREANGKGLNTKLDAATEAEIKRLYAMGLTEQAENLIKASSLGDPARALAEAKEDQMLLAIKQQEESLKDSQKRLAALIEFEKKAQPLREQIAAFDAGAAANQYSADALREQNSAVKAALEALALFEAGNAQNYAASARGEKPVEITIPAQDVYTREQMEALLKGIEKIPGIELRLDKMEAPAKPSATDVMAITGV